MTNDTRKTGSVASPQQLSAPWLKAPATQAVFDALKNQGHLARAVGGAPRNTLAGLPVSDIDIATTAKPEETIAAADQAGLKSIATGLSHGTITIISEGQPFEVTTLREDVETDGRHAKVAFTDDWARDAARRDFTINALYVDADGQVFDPVGGVEDLASGQVRFIGDAKARIEEDYLRILRFFRFTSNFSNGAIDELGLAACKAGREGLAQLSGERIHSELWRLLTTPNAADMIAAMENNGIFAPLFPHPIKAADLAHLIAIEDVQERDPDPVRRFSAMAISDISEVANIQKQLKLSNTEVARLTAMAEHRATPPRDASLKTLRARIYHIGSEAFVDTELLTWVRSGDDPFTDWRFQRLAYGEDWNIPTLPITGGDIVARGIPSGPKIGEILAALEAWWIEADFPTDAAKIDAQLTQLLKVTKF